MQMTQRASNQRENAVVLFQNIKRNGAIEMNELKEMEYCPKKENIHYMFCWRSIQHGMC